MFLEIWEQKEAKKHKPIDITPPPKEEFELRVIVWKTKDVVFKDAVTKMNDLYVQGSIGELETQETDTHWRCRTMGSFNWRWKFPLFLPLDKERDFLDIFVV